MIRYDSIMRESSLLQHIYGHNIDLPSHVTIPPGDDMGALRVANTQVLVTVDQIVDGVHVRLDRTPLDRIAHKAIVRNLSDVAAMAALPIGAVVAACLPRDFGEQRSNELFDDIRAVADRYNCPLIGGDISMWDAPMVLSVTVLAKPAGVPPVLRGGAKVGDGIYITGRLGGAWDEQGGGPHLTAEPRIAVARVLATTPTVGLHSMIDLSDGLASDLKHICAASSVAGEVQVDAIPCRDTIRSGDRAAWQHAMTDGEDYELCFTADGKVPQNMEGVPITRIGTIIEGEPGGITLILEDGSRQPLSEAGWEHGST